MSIAEGIAVGLSVYGAGLSTYLAREQRRRDKAQLQVSGNAFLRVWDDASMKFMVQIKATNLGLRRVEIHQAGFLEADGAERFVPLSELTPHEPVKAIEDGETAVFYYDLEDVIQGAPDGGGDPMQVYVDDGAGRRFRGPLVEELPHPERDNEGHETP